MTRHQLRHRIPQPSFSAQTPIRAPGASPGTKHHNPRPPHITKRNHPRPTHRRAFTLAEAVVSVAVVGVMLVAVMNTVGAARGGEYKLANENRGLLLAKDLMAGILQQPYAEPGETIPALGEDGAENNGKRDGYDDVDDYAGWSAMPPQRKDGTEMSTLIGWERSVEVDWVNLNDLSQIVGSSQGVKRITVIVKHNGMLIAKLIAFRSDV